MSSTQKGRQKTKRLTLLLFLISLSIWIYWGNIAIQTTQYSIKNESVPSSLHGFKIVQVSDLHNTEFGKNQNKLLNAIKKESPDIIAITGDLIDSRHTDIGIAMEFVKSAIAIAPVYYVPGNHEARISEYDLLKEQLQQAGVILLNDSYVEIAHKGTFIKLIGVIDPSFEAIGDLYENNIASMYQKLKNLTNANEKTYTILLSHRPELLKAYEASHINLVFSGHAHGGQFRLPLLGGFVAPHQGIFPQYTSGVYEAGQTNMVVSRGLGNSIIPVRFNNRPELVVVTLASLQK